MPKLPPAIHVYFRSDLELADVKLRATLLGKKLSTYIRDLVVIDLHMAGLKPFLNTKEGLAHYRQTGENPTLDNVRMPVDDTPVRPMGTPEQVAEFVQAGIDAGLKEQEEPTLEDILKDL